MQRVAQIDVSWTMRCTGCDSSCTLPAWKTAASRSRGGRSRATQPRSTTGAVSRRCSARWFSWCDSVHGVWPSGHRLERRVRESPPQAAVEARLDVAHPLQLAPAVRRAPARLEARGAAGLGQVLGGEHAAADRLVHALDLRHVERAGRVADEEQARRVHARQRLPAAGGDRARAVGEDLAALEQRPDLRVVLELLERLEGLEARVLVVEPGDVADVHAVAVEVIQEAAAVGARVDRPADRVLDQAGLGAARRAAATAP